MLSSSVTSNRPSGATFIDRKAGEVIVPALWGQDTFTEKAGGSEILGQMWAFPDKKGRPVCLVPEATAIFQEAAVKLLDGRKEAMFFYCARCYRYEKPQEGRYREFTQLGFEYLSQDTQVALDVSREVCIEFLNSVGLRYEFDASTKRGLTYYLQGEGFEVRCQDLGAQKQIAGGGAYREGAGFAIGLERLALALRRQERF